MRVHSHYAHTCSTALGLLDALLATSCGLFLTIDTADRAARMQANMVRMTGHDLAPVVIKEACGKHAQVGNIKSPEAPCMHFAVPEEEAMKLDRRLRTREALRTSWHYACAVRKSPMGGVLLL